MSAFETEEIVSYLTDWLAALGNLSEIAASTNSRFPELEVRTMSEIKQLSEEIERIPEPSADIDDELFALLSQQDSIKKATHSLDRYKEYTQLAKSLSEVIPLGDDNSDTLGHLKNIEAEYPNLRPDQLGLTFREAQDSLEAGRLELEMLERMATFLKEKTSEIGIESPSTFLNAYKIIYAFAVLGKTDRDVLLNLHPALIDEKSGSFIVKGASLAEALNSRAEKSHDEYEYKKTENPDDLREYALTIRASSFWSRVLPSYRSAKQRYMKMSRGIAKKKSREEMAAALEDVAALLDAIQDFENDDELSSACGPTFEGLNTNFNLCQKVYAYGQGVSKQFAGLDTFTISLRKLLLKADPDLHTACISYTSQSTFHEAKKFLLERLQKRDDMNMEVSVEIDNKTQSLSSLSKTCRNLQDAECTDVFRLSEIHEICAQLNSLIELKESIGSECFLRSRLGRDWLQILSDIDVLQYTLVFARKLQSTNLEPSIEDFLFSQKFSRAIEELQSVCRQTIASIEREASAREKFVDNAGLDLTSWFKDGTISDIPLEYLRARLTSALDCSVAGLSQWANYVKALHSVETTAAMSLIESYLGENEPLRELKSAFEAAFYRSLAKIAFSQNPILGDFSGLQHQQIRRDYARFDSEILELQRKAVAAKLTRQTISPGNKKGYRTGWTDLALIKHEMGKKKRHLPLRQLLDRAFNAIIEMKPCFMMSPISAAQFLKPGSANFDIVIIDEASQMKPENALSSILRARQLVVVGDPKQLPPTSFFDIHLDDSEDENYEELADNESILDAAKTMFPNECRLKWHYRSRHESLIAFSNRNFYDDELIVFPSSGTESGKLGVSLQYVGGTYRKGINIGEVKEVVARTLAIMETEPNCSLGLVTMNQKQADLLNSELDMLYMNSTVAKNYRERWEGDIGSLFVKNLENVQGDERDIILISTVYGPEEAGGAVAQRFGPINSPGGHRRLNVLFTRARRRVEVFTSMKPSDILPSGRGHQGPEIMKKYLEYAQVGRLNTGGVTGREPDSEFEIFVMNRLKSQGYRVVPQVGVAGFFIDLAIEDPNGSGMFILGVECDGATYHSAKDARDRDRIRQCILEQLGWKIHRVWSTDWFNDADAEMDNLTQVIKSCASTKKKGNTTGLSTIVANQEVNS